MMSLEYVESDLSLLKKIKSLLSTVDDDLDIQTLMSLRKYKEVIFLLQTRRGLENKSVPELRKLASNLGISYYARLSKKMLISLIHDRSNAEAGSEVRDQGGIVSGVT